MIVRTDGLPDDYLPSVPSHHRNDLLRNDGLSGGFLPSSQSSQRVEIGVRNDVLSNEFIPNSPQQRLDLGVRTDGLSTGYLPTRVRNDGLQTDYLPGPHRNDISGVRNDGLSGDYLPTSQSMVHDVQFVAASSMFDYDFIVSDVPTPGVGLEAETESKFFSNRQFIPDDQSSSVLENASTGNDISANSCQVLQHQQQQQQHDHQHHQPLPQQQQQQQEQQEMLQDTSRLADDEVKFNLKCLVS